MENVQFVQLRNLLDDIFRKVSNIEAEVQVLRGEVASLQTATQTTRESHSADLKSEFEDFKAQWQSETPDVQALKDNLLKLRASLGGLSEVLSGAEVTESATVETG
jgi:chromosome segregation ATPase